ncbi:MAG TPA: type I restriction enzyme HsdR N-terminal domain-containing protein [Flavobacteriaceae bacterium]|nr:type I restriction enzyme HsdR N-terminal domain-containing protein [Flavobacteriaceae bacterium]
MQPLNFPEYRFRFKNSENKTAIFDVLRKKFILLSPEEWVRQHTVFFLMREKKYPEQLLNVEKKLLINGLTKRYDVVGYNSDGTIRLIVECKAPKIKITQEVFDQIARYNLTLNAEYLMVTNGLQHYFCQLDYEAKKYRFLKELPAYS